MSEGDVISSGSRTRLIAEGSALAAVGIGAAGLAGWLTGVAGLARWTDASIPISPGSSGGILVLGTAVFLHARWPARRGARLTAATAAVIVAGLSLLILAQFVVGFSVGLERPFGRSAESVLDATAALVSPVTAIVLFLAATSLVNQFVFPRGAGTGPGASAALGAGVVTVALVVLAGYGAGAPLMFGGGVHPVALPTASGLALLGVALVAGAFARPARLDAGASVGAIIRRSARMRYVPIALAVGASLVLSGVLATIISRLEEAGSRAAFELMANRSAATLTTAIERTVEAVQDVRGLFVASREVHADEFRAFASAELGHGAVVDVLGWAPRVTDAVRSAFEAGAAREGLRNFRIVELDARDSVVTAARRAEYYPIYFMSVPHGGSGAVRFDLGSEPKRRETLERALEGSVDVAASVPVAARRPGHVPSVLLVAAVYRGGTTPGTAAARRDRLAGFAIGAFHAADVVAAARRQALSPGVAWRLSDVSDPAHSVTVYADSAFSAQNGALSPVSIPIAVADRVWMAEFRPTAAYFAQQRSLSALLVFGGGLLLTILIAAHLYSLERHTADLETAHEKIAESEVRFRAISDSAVDGIITIDVTGTIVQCNAAAVREFGYEEVGLLGRNVRDLVPPSHLAAHTAGLARYAATGASLVRGEALELPALRRDGSEFPMEMSLAVWETHEGRFATAILHDITVRKAARDEREQLIVDIQDAVAKMKTLGGLVPICAWCKKIRDDKGYWTQLEGYLSQHTAAEFSHGMCPDCEKKFEAVEA